MQLYIHIVSPSLYGTMSCVFRLCMICARLQHFLPKCGRRRKLLVVLFCMCRNILKELGASTRRLRYPGLLQGCCGQVQLWEVRGPDDFERVFTALREERPDGLYVPGGPLTRGNEQRLVAFAVKSGIPSVHDSREAVEAGGLISYA